MADAIANYDSAGVFDYVSDLLGHRPYRLRALKTYLRNGRILIASTHPTGIP